MRLLIVGEVSDLEVIDALAERDDIEFYREELTQQGKFQIITITSKQMRQCRSDNLEVRG